MWFTMPKYRSCTSQAETLHDVIHGTVSCWRDPRQSSPLTTPHFLICSLTTYWTLLFLLHKALRGRRASFSTSRTFLLIAGTHNASLALCSLIMLLGASSALLDVIRTHGARATLCTSPATGMPGGIEHWLYMFYVSKLWEFCDTFLLILRGRPVTVLHLWHHSSVAVETRAWLDYGMTLGVYGMWFNCLIHVVMYSYYFCAILNIPFPFKRIITVAQIVQFLTSFVFIVPFFRFSSQQDGCTGLYALLLSAFLNASYLVLFLRFYCAAYSQKSSEVGKMDKTE